MLEIYESSEKGNEIMIIAKARRMTKRQLQEKVQRRLSQYGKRILFPFRRRCKRTQLVFIMGYGRSGTTMLLNSFERDMRIEVLGENDPRIAENYVLVCENIAPALEACKAEVLVMKPILNSFDAEVLLNDFRDSKLIWMIRDYKDVVASASDRFGPTVADYMRQHVRFGEGDNWLARGLPRESLKELNKLNTETFTDHDWMALVWWAVNKTICIHDLCKSERLLLVKYEELVRNVGAHMHRAYEFIGLPYAQRPGAYMHAASVGKGADTKLDETVNQMCLDLSLEIDSLCE